MLTTHQPNPPGVIGFPTLDSGKFTAWQTQTLNYLSSNLPSDNIYFESFKTEVSKGYQSSVEQGIGILEALIEDINSGNLSFDDLNRKKSINDLFNVFDKFHQLARQLKNRYANKETLNVKDEYDVQDLLHTVLHLYFDDIRPEEWTPSYAGKSSRMDFLLKDIKTVIEVKKTRDGLKAKELGSQLIEDIARYKTHPDCENLVCFTYDPEGFVDNPRGIENDLSIEDTKMNVKVIIRP